jgi:uncharacterized protein (DUF885 family)
MRFTKKFINAICCFVLMTSVTACGTSSPGGEFQAILDEHWENAESEQVFFRTDPDAWRMNGKLAEFTAEARARRRDFNEAILARLETIDIDDLDPDNQVSYRLFLYERLTERDSYSQKDHFFPFSSLTGYHTYFAEAPAAMSFLSAEDYERYLVSLADFPRYNGEHIALLREAISAGYTHYCESIEGYEETISVHIVDDVTESGLYVPFVNFPSQVSEEQRADFTARGVELIETRVIPGYQELLDFYLSEYLPAWLVLRVSMADATTTST